MTAESQNSGMKGWAVAGQWLCKHISTSIKSSDHYNKKELLEMVFSMQSPWGYILGTETGMQEWLAVELWDSH
jgi:hypothetical protein